MKIGVAGLGFMGSTHLQAYQAIAGAEIAAVASSDEQKLAGDLSTIQGNLERPGESMDFGSAARYKTPEEMFGDPNVEAVDLCVPSHLHASLSQAALNAGKHVLVEKPMAMSGQECDAMVATSHKCNKVLMVAQVIRFWPDYVAARNIVQSGELGAVKAAVFRRKCAAPAWGKWMHDRSKSGGGVFDCSFTTSTSASMPSDSRRRCKPVASRRWKRESTLLKRGWNMNLLLLCLSRGAGTIRGVIPSRWSSRSNARKARSIFTPPSGV